MRPFATPAVGTMTFANIDKVLLTIFKSYRFWLERAVAGRWTIRTFTRENGDRSALAIDQASGLPAYQPNAYMLMHRQGIEFNSYRKELECLLMVHEWAEWANVDLDAALDGAKGLGPNQIESLTDHLRERRDMTFSDVVEPSTWYRRVGWARGYLLKRLEQAEFHRPTGARDALAGTFQTYAPPRGAGKSGSRAGMPVSLVPRLTEIAQPEHPKNPWAKRDRLRNWILVRLWLMGLRLGETLTLRCASNRVDDPNNDLYLTGAHPTLAVRVRPPNPNDPRKSPPTVKTLGRLLPLDLDLARDLVRYLKDVRGRRPGTHRHPYLIVGSSGQPLSVSGAERVWKQLRETHGLFAPYCIHSLRHTATDMVMDALGKNTSLNPQIRRDMINFGFGWAPTSEQSTRYAQSYIMSVAEEAMKESTSRNFYKPGNEDAKAREIKK